MRYEAPDTIDAAVKLLASEAGLARVLAGGTDLLVQMRSDVVSPDLLVDIKKISEVRQVTEEGGGFRVGAAVTGAELKEHPKLPKVWPGLVESANLIGSTQVQGRATAAVVRPDRAVMQAGRNLQAICDAVPAFSSVIGASEENGS